MNKLKKYSVMCLLLVIAIVSYGCGETLPVVDPPVVIPDCVGLTTYQWQAEVDIMQDDWTDFNVIYGNGGVSTIFIFLKKGRIDWGNSGYYKNSVTYSIPEGSVNVNEMNAACRDLRNANHNTSFPNYVMGLDYFLYSPEGLGTVGWANGPNHSGNWGYWSFVYSGRVKSIYGTGSQGKEVVEAILVHEIGHQIAIIDHGQHEGNDAAHCVMKSPYEPEMLERFQFCDRHICIMYNEFDGHAGSMKANDMKVNTKFSCAISLDKKNYVEGESVWISIRLKNETGKNDSLPYGSEFETGQRFKVKNDQNKNSYYHGSFAEYLRIPYKHFKPFEDTTYHVEITNTYGFEDENTFDYGAMVSYFPVGNYSVQLAHEEAGLLSNALTFSVVRPDQVELKRLEELRVIYATENLEERINKYQNFIDNNKNSIYTEQTIGALNRCYYKNEDSSLYKINNFFIDNYPNSFYATTIILKMWKYKYKESNNVATSNQILTDIIREQPNTFSQKIADYYLQAGPWGFIKFKSAK